MRILKGKLVVDVFTGARVLAFEVKGLGVKGLAFEVKGLAFEVKGLG